MGMEPSVRDRTFLLVFVMSEEDNKCLYLASYVLGPGHRRLKAYGAFDFKHSCTHCGVKGRLKDFTFPNKRNHAFKRTF